MSTNTNSSLQMKIEDLKKQLDRLIELERTLTAIDFKSKELEELKKDPQYKLFRAEDYEIG